MIYSHSWSACLLTVSLLRWAVSFLQSDEAAAAFSVLEKTNNNNRK